MLAALDDAIPPRVEVRTGQESGRLPLEGVKVADFSWIGVGPITAKALADHGATVVHVESDNPADRLRLVGPFKDGIPGINRCQFFNGFNTSKLSLQLNLKHPTGVDIATRLLAWCDIALDSFTAGTMNDLGIGYDVAREVNPGIIMATTCLLGQYGPAAKLAGYGYHAAAISGFYEITGWPDRPPAGPFNAYTDTVAPRFLTAVLLAALDHKRRTGEGQFIDQAQMESALHFISPELLDVQVSGTSARRNGNVDPDCVPHDAYPCAGDDEWCAIAVETDEQWRALRARARRSRVGTDPALDTVAGRRAAADAIDEELDAFTVAPRAAAADGDAADGGRAVRHGAALERPPARSAARPPQLLPPARAPGDGRGPVRGPPVPHLRLRQRPAAAGAVPRRAHLRGPHRRPRPRRRRGRRGPRQRRLRLSAGGVGVADMMAAGSASTVTGMEITDRVAIVTGGGGGIGSAVARHWMAQGARAVVVADRNGDAARAVGEEIGCLGVELDVTDEAAIIALVERVEARDRADRHLLLQRRRRARAGASRRRTRRGRCSGSCT